MSGSRNLQLSSCKTQSEPEKARDGAGREGGVSWRFFSQLTARATLEIRDFRGSKSSEKTDVSPG